jgi:hypothetical protein
MNKIPEYFEDAFPRDGFPRYRWTKRPAELPDRVWLSETTHRDGQQGGLPLTAARRSITSCVTSAVIQAPSGWPNFSRIRLPTGTPWRGRSIDTRTARPSSRQRGSAVGARTCC